MSGEWLFTQNYNKNIMVKKEEDEERKRVGPTAEAKGRVLMRETGRERKILQWVILYYILYIYLLDLKEGEWKNVL